VEHHNLPTLQEAGMRAFYNVVFEAIKGELTRAGAFACAGGGWMRALRSLLLRTLGSAAAADAGGWARRGGLDAGRCGC